MKMKKMKIKKMKMKKMKMKKMKMKTKMKTNMEEKKGGIWALLRIFTYVFMYICMRVCTAAERRKSLSRSTPLQSHFTPTPFRWDGWIDGWNHCLIQSSRSNWILQYKSFFGVACLLNSLARSIARSPVDRIRIRVQIRVRRWHRLPVSCIKLYCVASRHKLNST